MPLDPTLTASWECEGCGRLYTSREAALHCADLDESESD